MSAFSVRNSTYEQLISEIQVISQEKSVLPSGSDDSEFTSRYPVNQLKARIKSLAYIVLDTVSLLISLMTEKPDETEAWIKNKDCIDNETDSNKIFISELLACYRIYREDPEVEETYKTYVLKSIDQLKGFAEDCQRLRVNTILVSEELLASLGEVESLSRLWQEVKLNNKRVLRWSCSILQWCRQKIPELICDPIYEAESACKDMYATIHEVPCIIAKLLYTFTNQDIYKCRDTHETLLDTSNTIKKFNQTNDSVPLSKLLELNSLRISSSKVANLHTSLYAEIRNIKYTVEEIGPPIIIS